jgi:DNA-binding NtrC family response regulator
LIVDRQKPWRDFSARSLETAGFLVRTLDSYDCSAFDACVQKEKPDLVLFGCAAVEPEDQEMIENILRHRFHLLVLCTSPSWLIVHGLFRAGAADIVDKSYDPNRLLTLVNQTLESLSPRNSYQAAAAH